MQTLKKDQILKVFPQLRGKFTSRMNSNKLVFNQKPAFYCLDHNGKVSLRALSSKYALAFLIEDNRRRHQWTDQYIDGEHLISIETGVFDYYRGTTELFKNNLVDKIPVLICRNYNNMRFSQGIYYVKTMSNQKIVLKEIK